MASRPQRARRPPRKDEFDDTESEDEDEDGSAVPAAGKNGKGAGADSDDDDSDEDFENPDEIEIPGGGMSLQQIAEKKALRAARPRAGGNNAADITTKSLLRGRAGGSGIQLAGVPGSSFGGGLSASAVSVPRMQQMAGSSSLGPPPLLDLTADDDGVEIVKEISKPGSSRMGMMGRPGGQQFNPYMSSSMLQAQDPYSSLLMGPGSTEMLAKSVQNGNLNHLMRNSANFQHLAGMSGGGGGMGMNNYAAMSGGAMFPGGGAAAFAAAGSQPGPGVLAGAMPKNAISNLWMTGQVGAYNREQQQADEEEVAAEDEDDMGVIETYSNYMPKKLKIGKPHPDAVVETASMASVDPPDVTYELMLPDELIEEGKLSALQLESVTYSCQKHEQFLEDGNRAGFLIGDGAGVGKGRTIAGIIFENFLQGRKRAIWVSVSNDLKYDAERDLKDIGATGIDVYFLSKMKYAKINSSVNNNVRKGVMYATYSALIGESQGGGKYRTRMKQLLHWCGDDFDGAIIFDECHRAKNLCPSGASKPTKTGQAVLELQVKLPKARIIYASATGASEPKHMAYMVRLGIWGKGSPFNTFNDFLGAVEKRGVGAMEIVAMDMKLRGMYIARQLSFQGVSFRIDEVELSPAFRKIYNASVDLWVELLHKFNEAGELIDADKKMRKTMWGQFWSSHQRFFKYLCIASKVPHVISTAASKMKEGKCVVIGLQSTGEARTMEALEREEELTDFVSTAKGVLQSLVEKHFPAPDQDRINKVLGIVQGKNNILDELNIKPSNGQGTSDGKRGKRKAVIAGKKKTNNLSHLDDSDDVDSDNGSDFAASDEEEEEDDDDFIDDEDEEEEEDYNPFGDGSDDEDEPWNRASKKRKATGSKKGKKAKKPKPVDPFQHLFKPKPVEDNNGISVVAPPPPRDNIARASAMKREMLQKIEDLGTMLPANTLDQLIDELGGPENVSEMTGRKGRVVTGSNGDVRFESRSEQDIPLETLNIHEKDRFMRGDKLVAVISEAASSGISLQADRRVKNQRRRVHMTLELPWSADRAIQQFGRTHRSNQVSGPEYILLISDLAGEHRFASIVAKRLESLGALTHGDRRATESRDLSRFNIDNKYGRAALEAVFKAIMGYETPIVKPPADYKGEFFKDIADGLVGVGLITQSDDMRGVLVLDKGYNDMAKFLNRILGLKVEIQNLLFQYFTDTLNAIINQAKRAGRYDQGILDVGLTEEDHVELQRTHSFKKKHATGMAEIELHVLHVERGLSWDQVMDKWNELVGKDEGFYLSHQIRNNKKTAILAQKMECSTELKKSGKDNKKFIVFRPNTGQQVKTETLAELKKKYRKVDREEAKRHWNDQYESSKKRCSHAYWRGNCKNATMGSVCEVGLRRKTYNVLCGSVLSVWSTVEQVLTHDGNKKGTNSKMQVVRLKLDNSKRIVGTLIPTSAMSALCQALSASSERAEETIY